MHDTQIIIDVDAEPASEELSMSKSMSMKTYPSSTSMAVSTPVQKCDSTADSVPTKSTKSVPANLLSQSCQDLETNFQPVQRRESSSSTVIPARGASQSCRSLETTDSSLQLSPMAPMPTNQTPETAVRGRAAAMASAKACPFGFGSNSALCPVISADECDEEELAASFMKDDIFRAVRLSVLLKGMGLIFKLRQAAEKGTHGQEAAIIPWDRTGFSKGRTTWDLSFHAGAQLDWFVSHSWKAAWWKRALSLMWIFNSMISAVVSSAGAVIVTLSLVFWQFQWTGEFWEDFEGFLPMGFAIVAGMLVVFLFILVQGHMLIPSTRRQTVFFDRCCIHQTDKETKVRGIKGIGHFLKCSKGMVVLWDPTYFSRMWCMFELATFALVHSETGVKDDNNGKIDKDRVVKALKQRVRIIPIHFIIHRLISIAALCFICVVDSAAYYCGFSNKLVTCSLVFAVHIFTVLSVATHERALHKEAQRQLETFDICKANVTFESDREFVLKHVRNLWGDEEAFNQFVRNEFLDHVIHSGALSCCSSLMALKPFRTHVLPGFTLCVGALTATIIAAPVAAYVVAAHVLA
jgi:hypothetical protein